MSRVAKNPVKLPAGVEIKLAGQQLSVKGAKGTLELNVHSSVEVVQESGELRFAARNGDQQSRAMAGTTRALVNNMVIGVSAGFERKLQLVGVGYKAQAKGQVLNLALGFSHPIDYELPEGVVAETPNQTEILIKGVDKQLVTRLRRARKARLKMHELEVVRLCVYRSSQHIYAQVISADGGKVLASASTLDKALRDGATGNVDAAKKVGALVAERAKAAGVTQVAFDRSGFKYHGRVKALADAAREGGLEF